MRHKYAALAAILVAGCAAPVPKAVELTRPVPAVTPAKVQVSFTRFVMSTDQVEGDAGVAGRQVTIDDPVRVASISKLIVALAVMRLVDDGKVNLDRDVGEYLGWPIRNPAFPATPITLRQLMSHRAGLRDEIDYILPLDGDLAQILSDPRAWDRLHGPGTFFQYANINSPLIAATIEGATGERFDRLMSRLVLEPLGLDACFNWATGCSSNRRAQAVTLLRPNGVLAKDPRLLDNQECGVQPAGDGSCDIEKSYRLARNGSAFSPQGGLRISPRDLARVGQLLLNSGKPLLSRRAFDEMLGPVWTFDGTNGSNDKGYFQAYGLGIHWLADGKGGQWIGHVGEAYSLRAGFWINIKEKRGFVRYVTMVDEFAPVGHCFDACP